MREVRSTTQKVAMLAIGVVVLSVLAGAETTWLQNLIPDRLVYENGVLVDMVPAFHWQWHEGVVVLTAWIAIALSSVLFGLFLRTKSRTARVVGTLWLLVGISLLVAFGLLLATLARDYILLPRLPFVRVAAPSRI